MGGVAQGVGREVGFWVTCAYPFLVEILLT